MIKSKLLQSINEELDLKMIFYRCLKTPLNATLTNIESHENHHSTKFDDTLNVLCKIKPNVPLEINQEITAYAFGHIRNCSNCDKDILIWPIEYESICNDKSYVPRHNDFPDNYSLFKENRMQICFKDWHHYRTWSYCKNSRKFYCCSFECSRGWFPYCDHYVIYKDYNKCFDELLKNKVIGVCDKEGCDQIICLKCDKYDWHRCLGYEFETDDFWRQWRIKFRESCENKSTEKILSNEENSD